MKEDFVISKRKLLISCLLIGLLVVIVIGRISIDHGVGMHPRIQKVAQSYHRDNRYQANHNQPSRYRIHPVNWRTQRITGITPLYANLQMVRHAGEGTNTTARMVGNAGSLVNLIQPQKVATAPHQPTYVQIKRQGKNLGWIKQRALKPTNRYLLPYVYTSQFWPSAVPDACEIASLKTAMSTQNKAMGVSLRQMVEAIPRTNNPNRGYTHNPYVYSSHATIYPDAMVKVARRYGARAKNITGASESEFINDVTHGKPVVFEGPYMMEKPGSDHDLVILGYKPHYFYVADPFARHHYSPKTTWVSTKRLMMLFNRSFRHQRALVVE